MMNFHRITWLTLASVYIINALSPCLFGLVKMGVGLKPTTPFYNITSKVRYEYFLLIHSGTLLFTRPNVGTGENFKR